MTLFNTKVQSAARESYTAPGEANVVTGEGIIILLCGPPGVGKTLTAEAGETLNPTVILWSSSLTLAF